MTGSKESIRGFARPDCSCTCAASRWTCPFRSGSRAVLAVASCLTSYVCRRLEIRPLVPPVGSSFQTNSKPQRSSACLLCPLQNSQTDRSRSERGSRPQNRWLRGSPLDAREAVDGSASSVATRVDPVPCVRLKRLFPSRSFQKSQSKRERKTLQIRVVEPGKQPTSLGKTETRHPGEPIQAWRPPPPTSTSSSGAWSGRSSRPGPGATSCSRNQQQQQRRRQPVLLLLVVVLPQTTSPMKAPMVLPPPVPPAAAGAAAARTAA